MERADSIFIKIYNRLSKEFKIAFISAIIIGLIAHLYMFTNKLPNYDDINNLNGFGATFRLGRWFLWILGAVSYHLDYVYSIPLVNGLVSVILIALASGLIADLLKLKSLWSNIFLGGILVAFPSWVGTFFFMFTAPYYALAVLLMVISAYIIVQKSKYFWISVIFIALSMGIYQAYLPFMASLLVILLVVDEFDSEKTNIKVFKNAFFYFLILLSGVILYYIFTMLSLNITGEQLADYKGISEMGELSLSGIYKIFKNIIINFAGIVSSNTMEISYNPILKIGYLIVIIISGVLIIFGIIDLIKKGEKIKAVEAFIISICFFVAVNSIFIICQDREGIYSIMTYSYVFLLILPLCLIDRMLLNNVKNNKLLIATEYVLVLTVFSVLTGYCIFSNAQYLSIQLSYEQASSYYTTLVTKIKSVEGYTDDMPVTFVGSRVQDKTFYKNEIMNVFDMSGRDDTLIEPNSREYFLKYYCGFEPQYISADGIAKEITEQMPAYPDSDSIIIVDDVVVVKFR